MFSLRNLLSCLLAGIVLLSMPLHAQQIGVSLSSIEHPAFKARGVVVTFDVFQSGRADILISELRFQNVEIHDLTLHCDRFRLDDAALVCADGTVRRRGRQPVAFALEYGFASHKLDLTLRGADVSAWSAMIDGVQQWHPLGRFDLRLTADRDNANFDFAISGLGFSTADYSVAGEGINGKVSIRAHRKGNAWQWNAALDWLGGEAFYSPWYRKAGVSVVADGVLTSEQLRVDQARVTLDHVGSLTAGLALDRKTMSVTRWGFVTEPLDLAAAIKEWVQPVLEAHALPSISATGTTRYAAEWANGGLQFFYAGIENGTFKEGKGRLALTGVNASVPWSRTSATEAEVSVGGGTLDDFALGSFRVPLHLNGFDVAIKQVDIPFLDGRIRIEDFHAIRPKLDWTGRFSGGVEGVSMPRFTTAIGLPTMAGSLSMKIPAANYAGHVLDLGGDLVVDVFDGRVIFHHLKLIEPLGATSRFVSDVKARRLDLGLLTSTFSFGSILGRLDADIVGLELHNWKPLAFSARLSNSSGDYRRAISRGALIDISSLGGSVGAAAVRAIPTAGFFNTFRYDNIGFGCVLRDNICVLDGLYPENDGYVLVEGKGIPAIKVMGYNRRIDWNLLVSRLKAVVAGNSKAVIE